MIKPNRHRLCFLLFLSMLLWFSLPAQENILLKLPLRIRPSPAADQNIGSTDFRLFINDQPQTIETVLQNHSSLTASRGQNRIVLAFLGTHFYPAYALFLKNFCTEMLAPGDNLLLCTPLNTLPLAGKDAMDPTQIQNLADTLRDDVDVYGGMLQALQKNITTIIANFPTKLDKKKWPQNLRVYEMEVDRLKQHLLAAILTQFQKSSDFFATGPGPRFLILFTDDEMPFAQRIGWPFLTNDFLAAMGPELQNRLARLGDIAKQETWLPVPACAKALLMQQVSLLSWRLPSDPSISSDEGLFSFRAQLSPSSGGTDFLFTTPNEALAKIQNHRDLFYELVYSYDKRLEDKRFRLETDHADWQLIYCPLITAQEFATLSGQSPSQELQIDPAELQGRLLVFKVGPIKLQPGAQNASGRIRVILQVNDENGQNIFSDGQELQASQADITIRLPLPPQIQGYVAITITVEDLGSGQRQQKKVYGKL